MLEEQAPPGTQPTELPRLAASNAEAVLEAVALTHPLPGAAFAIRMPASLLLPETAVQGRLLQRLQGVGLHVAKAQALLYEKIAREYVPVVFHHEVLAAVGAEGADRAHAVHQQGQHRVEQPDGDATAIGGVPTIEKATQELAPGFRRDRERQEPAPLVGLHAGNVLVVEPTVLAEVVIHRRRLTHIRRTDQDQEVELGVPGFKTPDASQDVRVGPPPVCRLSVPVVQPSRTIQTDPGQEAVLGQQRRQVIGDQRRIGLEPVRHARPAAAKALLVLHRAAEEVDAQERGLAALPAELIGGLRRGHVTADHGRQNLIGHAVPGRLGVEPGVIKVETVRAAQIAVR